MRTVKTCTLTTILYFLTFMISIRVFTLITHKPIDLARTVSGPVIGICLVIIPYIFNGYFCRKIFLNPFKGALITSFILVISERLLIYLIGLMLLIRGGDGSMEGITVMGFIQGEAAPYYTPTYIFMGILSVGISVLMATVRKPFLLSSK